MLIQKGHDYGQMAFGAHCVIYQLKRNGMRMRQGGDLIVKLRNVEVGVGVGVNMDMVGTGRKIYDILRRCNDHVFGDVH
jgi:hypothetical protein